MGRIVLPQMRLGLAAAWVIAFVPVFGVLGVSRAYSSSTSPYQA